MKSSTPGENLSVKVLKEILKEGDNIEEVLVFVKSKTTGINLFHTGLDVMERSYIIQLLTSDIQQELVPTEELEFEPDV